MSTKLPKAFKTICLGFPFTLKLTVAFGVPAKFIVAELPLHIVVELEIDTVGNATTIN